MQTFDTKVRNRVKQFKSIPSMKHKTETELIEKAKTLVEKSVIRSDEGFDFKALFKKADDIKLAQELLIKYLSDFSVETQSDRSTLMQLIQLEIWHRHFSDKIEKALHESGKTPQLLLGTVHKNLDQIRTLKDMLGISSKDDNSPANYIQQLIKRGNIWSEKLNKADRTFFCQHCSKPNLLTFKINQYDPIKHPFFQGRYLTNHKLIKLYIEGKLSAADIGEVFDTAKIDYVDWLIKKFYNKEHLKNIQESQKEHYKKSFHQNEDSYGKEDTETKSI